MKKIISFALWGGKDIYTIGAIKNAKLAKEIFPDWICRFHIDNIPQDIIDELSTFDNVEIIDMKTPDWKDFGRRGGGKQPDNSMFWKFEPYFDPDVEVLLGRDPDSRLSEREKIAVDEWLESKQQFHIMRDHPGHCTGTPILGAMWGIKKTSGLDMRKLLDNYKEESKKDKLPHMHPHGRPLIDQWFLMKSIYPLVKDCSMIHHCESCSKGCMIPKSDPLFWTDGPSSEHKMFIPRKGLHEIIGLDINVVNGKDVPSAENIGKLKLWIDTGRYFWKR